MQSYFGAVAKAFPKLVGPAWTQIQKESATKPIDQVRVVCLSINYISLNINYMLESSLKHRLRFI